MFCYVHRKLFVLENVIGYNFYNKYVPDFCAKQELCISKENLGIRLPEQRIGGVDIGELR